MPSLSHRHYTTTAREIRQMEAEEQARIDAARAEAERPVREAQEQLNRSHSQLIAQTKANLLTLPDEESYEDPATSTWKITRAKADEYNTDEFTAWRESNPDAYLSEKNINALQTYFTLNRLQIVSRKTLQAAWDKLSSHGILESAPVVLEHDPEPEPVERPVQVSPEEQFTIYTTSIVATDPATKEQFTQFDVDRMSAEQYRRIAFPENFIPTIAAILRPKRN